MRLQLKITGLLLVSGVLLGCEQRSDLAPVIESKWRSTQHVSSHRVERGETLYAIAFRYDLDYRQLAQMNHIAAPYTLRVGQVLRVNSSYTLYRPERVRNIPAPARSNRLNHDSPINNYPRYKQSNTGWMMPADGRIIEQFAPNLGHKGINIAGEKGSKVRASANGTVAYAGNGLAGYGNLIIIKHNNQYMTAYGNNARNLVKVGQWVKSGQVIADMGMIDRRYYGVHFEIRNAGKPVNPRNYL